ncbi:GIY-YIG nuclease family protein [Endozoicomonas montiporae]|uniref:GIY-YIG nuclease family protein n=1 Tax=Endozoicomonas montiporae TaxID=1027273 RepID=UPI000A8E6294|nr:GIY-YIG nuclease family protein [Endozoicomonas montiporae]
MKSPMHFIKSALEYRHITELDAVPMQLRGIYALYQKKGKSYNLVYIGMSGKDANGKIRKRLFSHKRKRVGDWTHFSYFEVWDNITDTEIQELEGLFRQLYRFDSRSNILNIQQTYKPLTQVRRETEKQLELERVTKKSLGV